MSQLVQVKKLLTFEEIAPLWFHRLTTGKLNPLLSMGHCNCCIVGEAHGFKETRYGDNTPYTTYGCDICDDFSYGGAHFMSDLAAPPRFSDEESFPPKKIWTREELNNHPTVKGFVEHWNEAHVTDTGPESR